MIHIIHFSDGHKHFKEAIYEYEKRLKKHITIHALKPVKHTEIAYIKQKEYEKLKEKLWKLSGKIFLCDETGKGMKTQELKDRIKNVYNESENLIFIIGGSYWVKKESLQLSEQITCIKLSEMTLPHSLAFLVLIEQIYRSFEIIKWSSYHHE